MRKTFQTWRLFPARVFADSDEEVWRSGGLGVWGSGPASVCVGCVMDVRPPPLSLSLPPRRLDEQAHYSGADIEKGGQYIFWVDSQQRESLLLADSSSRLCNANTGGSVPVFSPKNPAAHTGILSKTPSRPQTWRNSFSPANRDYLHSHPVTTLPSTD